MNFDPDMVVADAIRVDPDVVERLVALDPTFRKLHNPVLRSVMARLVTFRDAARVSGVSLASIMAAANDEAPPDIAQEFPVPTEMPRPQWMDRSNRGAAVAIDVRAMLSAGDEPLSTVMREAAKVGEGGFLIITAPFDPAPLRRVLARKGFVSYAKRIGDGHWDVHCLRDEALAAAQTEPADSDPRQWDEGTESHIDVRGLSPPQPMLAIIALIERPDLTGPVIVHHEREPVFLYPELAERGWRYEIIPADSGEVRLRLSRSSAP